MRNTVVGVYDNYSQAQAAFNDLTARGFDRSNVQLSPEQESHESRTQALGHREESEGWSLGGFFRSLFGGDEDESGRSDTYHEAVRRGSYLVTVQADSDTQRDEACDILNRYDPVDIDERSSQWRSQGWSTYDRNAAPYTDDEIKRERAMYAGSGSAMGSTASNMGATNVSSGATAGRTGSTSRTTATGKTASGAGMASRAGTGTGGTLEGEARLPVIEEEIRVGKREVQRGGVRIYQHISEHPVEETVHLRDEKVNVQRQPVDKPATQADMAAFKEGSMELRETAEEPVVSKSARVVEEVVVGKDVKERDEKVRDTVRRPDVDVQPLGAGGSMDSEGFRQHWQTSYASQGGRYEDYEPAYRFGSELRGNQAYSGRNWNEVEPEARRDWEARHAGSPWERAKGAVRHAWERVSK